MRDEDRWRATWLCPHAESDPGERFPLGDHGGSYRIHICRACGSFCIKTHHPPRPLSDWHPPSFLAAALRGDRSLLK